MGATNQLKVYFVLLRFLSSFKKYICFALVLLGVNNAHASLSAKTKTIKGTAPYFQDSVNYLSTTDENKNFLYFSVKYNGATYSGNLEALNDAISSSSFVPVDPFIATPNSLLSALNLDGALMPFDPKNNATDASFVADDDNDVPYKINPPDGGFTIEWLYKFNGQTLALLDADKSKTFCELANQGWNPYIRVTGTIALVTEYGDPIYTLYKPKHDFYIYKAIKPTVCSARPYWAYSYPVIIDGISRDLTGDWKEINTFRYGLDVSSSKKFPTTGFDGAKFILFLAGVKPDISNVSMTTSSSNGVTMNLSSGTGERRNSALEVKLSGKATAVQPSFNIQTTNSNSVYSFTINKWFHYLSNIADSYDNYSAQACSATNIGVSNYVLPTIADLTNSPTLALCNGMSSSIACRDLSTNNYVRKIGEGVFSEWGLVTDTEAFGYPDASWPRIDDANSVGGQFWTSDQHGIYEQYAVSPYFGGLEWLSKASTSRFVCVLK